MEEIRLTKNEFDQLPDYSLSVPTGRTIGKRWKRQHVDETMTLGWVMGEYTEHQDANTVGIYWRKIVLLPGQNMERQQATQAELDTAIEAVREALMKRISKHGPGKFVSPAEALGTLVEEYHEAVDAQRSNDLGEFLEEMMDVCITCVWAEISLRYRKPWSAIGSTVNVPDDIPMNGDLNV